MKQEKCKSCGKLPKTNCEWRQGRCPHLPSLLDNIIIWFKGKFK